MIDPSYTDPSTVQELSDFAEFEAIADELLYYAKSGGTYVYQLSTPPAGSNPAYVAKR